MSPTLIVIAAIVVYIISAVVSYNILDEHTSIYEKWKIISLAILGPLTLILLAGWSIFLLFDGESRHNRAIRKARRAQDLKSARTGIR